MGAGIWVGACGAVLLVPVLMAGMGGSAVAVSSQNGPILLGDGVPEQYAQAVLEGGQTCPRIGPSVLAAQLNAESGWNPQAVSPAGAQGIAQFLPETWAAWGGDFDEDGTNSPFDADDAIHAQARYMCDLLDRILESSLAQDDTQAVQLTLAAYNAGLANVIHYRAIPPFPQTQAYVAAVMAAAAGPEYQLGLAEWDGEDIDSALPVGYRNVRSAAQAVAWAQTQVGVFRDAGYCLRFVATAFGPPQSGRNIAEAHHVWDNTPAQYRHPGDRDAPRGAILLWSDTIGSGAGHIAISLGNGQMITTTRGAVSIRPIIHFADSAYLGWMPPYFTRG